MNWYKSAYKSRLVSVSLKGKLKQTNDGFVYLDISNNVINGIFSLIDEDDIEKPPYDLGKYNGLGAHISVMNQDEFKEPTEIKEIGRDFSFKLDKMHSTRPEGWDDMERVWFLSVQSPELEKLRKKYKLPKSYKGKGHDFHITIAVRKKRKKAAGLSETLSKIPKSEGLKHFLNSLGFDENGREKAIDSGESKEEKAKKHREWREQEYEHMPA